MSKPTALLVSLWNHNLSALTTYLRRNKRVVLVYSDHADDQAVKMLEATGSQVVRINVPSNPTLLAEGRHAAERAKGALQARGLAGELPVSVNGAELLGVYESVLAQRLPSVYSLLNELQRVSQEYFIEAALVNEESLWLGKAVTEWAKQQGIPSIHLAHGTGILKNYNFEDYVGDTIAVFSERSADAYSDCGVPAEKLAIIGNPAWNIYSRLREQKSAIRQTLCQRTGLDPARPIIVFGTTWNAYLSTMDDRDLSVEVKDFLSIHGPLVGKGLQPQLVIKDRLATGTSNEAMVFDIARQLGVPEDQLRYELSDAQSWVTAADVVVSIDSNLSIEAILAETPAINLLTEFGLLAGPAFGPEDPVLQCEADALAATVARLLVDGDLRQKLKEKMRHEAGRFNRGVDGGTEERFAELIEKKRRVLADGQYVWQTLLNATDTDATQYHNWPRSELVDLVVHPPRKVLDIGCAAGKTGEYIKQKYPQAKVYGVEQNRAAAELAAQRLDSVFAGKFEDFDFATHGITPGSLDTVIVADVLEHIYSPWDVLVRLKPYLAPDAQILASIPNTRNLALMKDLAEGHWRYEAWGLLDVTHIRFFTLKEIRRFFHETGYHVARVHHNLDGRLSAFTSRTWISRCLTSISTNSP